MTLIDWIIVVIVAVSTLAAGWRGLVRSLISLAGWIAAFVSALLFGSVVAQWLPESWGEPARVAAGHVIAFFGVLFVAALFGLLASRIVRAIGLGGADRWLGALFGFARGALIVAVVSVLFSWTPVADAAAWRSSTLLPWVAHALEAVGPHDTRGPSLRI